MAQPRIRKPGATGAPGMKLLITAAALATTLGGWAVLARQETPTDLVTVSAPVVAGGVYAPVLRSMSLPEGAPPAQVQAAPQPSLRVVNAPPAVAQPAPMTMTRSSR